MASSTGRVGWDRATEGLLTGWFGRPRRLGSTIGRTRPTRRSRRYTPRPGARPPPRGLFLPLAHDVHGRLLRRRRGAVDALVAAPTARRRCPRAAAVGGDQPAGPHVAHLVVEQLAVGVGAVAEAVALVRRSAGSSRASRPSRLSPADSSALRGPPVLDRPRPLRRRPPGVQDVADAARVLEGVLRLEEPGGLLGVGAVRTEDPWIRPCASLRPPVGGLSAPAARVLPQPGAGASPRARARLTPRAAPAVFPSPCSLLGRPTHTVLAFMNSRMPSSVSSRP